MTLTVEQNELLDLRDRVHDLEEENLRLRLRLASVMSTPPEWRLTNMERRILIVLASAKEPLSDRAIEALIYGQNNDRCRHVIAVHMVRIRRKLEKHGVEIETVRGAGWALAPEMRERISSSMSVASMRAAP